MPKVLSPRQQSIVAIGSYTGRGDLNHLEEALAERTDSNYSRYCVGLSPRVRCT